MRRRHATHSFNRQGSSASRALLTATLLASICAHALAGDPPSATYPLRMSHIDPWATYSDVAVYAPCDQKSYLFAVDRGDQNRRIARFNGDGSSGAPQYLSLGLIGANSAIGVAAADTPGTCTFGRVFATYGDPATTWSGQLASINAQSFGDLRTARLCTVPQSVWMPSFPPGGGFWIKVATSLKYPADVALDANGDLYVADLFLKQIFRYSARDAAAMKPVLYAEQSYGWNYAPGFAADSVSVDHNQRLHASYQGASGSYAVFQPGGALLNSVPAPLPKGFMGVCALNPCADGFLPRIDFSSGTYDFGRFDWSWPTGLGAFNLDAGQGQVGRPEGIEFQKFNMVLGSGVAGYKPVRCEERLYICGGSNLSAFGQDYLSVMSDSSRRAWFRFEDVHDTCAPDNAVQIVNYLSGGPDATAGPVAPKTVEGMVRCAFDTRAGTAYATAPDHASFDFGSESFTIEGWLRSEQISGTITLLDKRVNEGAGYAVFLANGRIGLQINNGDTHTNYATGPIIADGRWRHFAATAQRVVDGPHIVRLFVDGLEVGQFAALHGNIDNASPLYIGRRSDGGGIALRGALDELTLYGSALDPSTILAIAQARSAGKHVWWDPTAP